MLEESRGALAAGAVVAGCIIQKVISASNNGITYAVKDADGTARVVKEYFPRQYAHREGTVIACQRGAETAFNDGLQRFKAVAKALLQLRNANIVSVTSIVETHGTVCIVMEHIDGVSLKDVLAKASVLGDADIRQVVFPVMHGLKGLHQLGIFHLAIRPENIMFRAGGIPVLVGFASWYERLAEGGGTVIIPNPGYAAIEQYSAQQRLIGPWTDIYALGAVLYHCIAGSPPPEAAQRYQAIKESGADVLTDSNGARRGEYPEKLLDVIDHALKLNPSDRPRDISSWMQELFDLEPVARRDTGEAVAAATPVLADPLSDPDEDTATRYKGYRAWLGGREQSYYMAQFIRQDDQGRLPRLSWNWAAFVFSTFWMVSRKMYIATAIVILITSTGIFPAVRMLFDEQESAYTVGGLSVDPALPTTVAILMAFCGLFGNYLYYLHIGSKVRRAARKFGDVKSQRKWLSDRGGTTAVAPVMLIVLLAAPAMYLRTSMLEEQHAVQEQIGEALAALNVAAEKVGAYRRRAGKWPSNAGDVEGLPANAAYRFIAELFITGQMIVATFKPEHVADSLAGKSLALFASPGEEGDRIVWTCGSINVPLEHLPADCRRKWK